MHKRKSIHVDAYMQVGMIDQVVEESEIMDVAEKKLVAMCSVNHKVCVRVCDGGGRAFSAVLEKDAFPCTPAHTYMCKHRMCKKERRGRGE